jgi:hypothetical protein
VKNCQVYHDDDDDDDCDGSGVAGGDYCYY